MTMLQANIPAAPGQVVTSLLMKRIAFAIVFILVAYLAGVKPIGISADLRNYEIIYNLDAILDWQSIIFGNDSGYHALSRLATDFGMSFDAFAFVLAFGTCVVLLTALTNIKANKYVVFALYMSYLFWLHEYTQIRAALAIAFAMYAIYGKSRFRWLAFIPAITVHNSLILLPVVYFGFLILIARPALIVVFGALTAMVYFYADFVEVLLARILAYQDLAAQGKYDTINLYSAMPLVQVFSLICAVPFIKSLSRDGRMEYAMSLVGVLAFYAFSSIPVLAFRSYEMFLPFFVVLLARLWDKSMFFKGVAVIYAMLGLRVSFFSDDSLVIP